MKALLPIPVLAVDMISTKHHVAAKLHAPHVTPCSLLCGARSSREQAINDTLESDHKLTPPPFPSQRPFCQSPFYPTCSLHHLISAQANMGILYSHTQCGPTAIPKISKVGNQQI